MSDLISRTAAIEAICALHIFGKSAIFGEYNENSYAEHLHDAVKAIEELPSAQQWIPVTERLPEIHQTVIYCLTDGTVLAGYMGEPDTIWQVTEESGEKSWVYDPEAYTDDVDSLPTANDCWFDDKDPDGMSYLSVTSTNYKKRFPGVVAWMPLPSPWKGET